MSEEKYYYPAVGEELYKYQPHLEFRQDNGIWVPSGLIKGRMRESFKNDYRVKITEVEE